ncbi:MAG: type II toxin-antitoxin system mRNA interferase toxin, RelE/StbE family [Gammaproteobacteria bacterium]|nr:MAG: type II toxin-antitoxin system mRNA interferase toxin, RelE/StbE family [Gammaproteobacteria bacterium]
MAKYSLTFKKSVTKDLRVIPNIDVSRILNKIEQLAENPRPQGYTKLTGNEKYRVRQGSYRIIYEIKDAVLIINVIKVAHRSSVYNST